MNGAFEGLTDRELTMALMAEFRRRELYGCVFLFPANGGASVFASSTPEGTMAGMSAWEQLDIFSQVAAKATSEHATVIDGVAADPSTKKWVN